MADNGKQQSRLGMWSNPKCTFSVADVQWLENMRKIHGQNFGRTKLTPKPAQLGKPS